MLLYLRKKFFGSKPYPRIALTSYAGGPSWEIIPLNAINSGYHKKNKNQENLLSFIKKRNYSTKIKRINNNKKISQCNNDSNKKGKINLTAIFYFFDISRLYLIKKESFQKYSLIIFFIIAVLFGGSLYQILFISEIDLSVYYSTWSIIPSLCMVYLICRNRDCLIKFSIKSVYMIINLALLSLILGLVLYIVANYLFFDFYTLSFNESFDLSKKIIGGFLTLKITYYFINKIYHLKNKPNKLCEEFLRLILFLMVLAFFYQVVFVIFGAVFLVINAIDLDKIQWEIKNKNNSVQSELKIENKSLNHHFNKYYPIIIKGEGLYLTTEYGSKIFDACSGAAVSNIGYGNPYVIDSIHEKYKSGTHYLASSFWKDKDVSKLQEFLVNSTHGALSKVFLTGSGSDATEAALKLARQYFYDQDPETSRNTIISRAGSYHGNTIGALSVSEFKIRQEPYKDILLEKVEHVSSCYSYRQQLEGESNVEFVARKVDELEKMFQKIGPEKVMAFILEPVSGAALGCVPAVPGYIEAMKLVCHKYGALLILDEVMCGMGRTGFSHAWQIEGVAPDILIIGKGLGAGYHPIAAILVAQSVWEVLKTEQFIHGLTFDAVPVGAVAALKVQEIIEKDFLLDNVKNQGDYLGERLTKELGNHPNVGDIRGKGLFWGLEFVKNKETKEPFDSKLGVSHKIVHLAKSPEFNMTFYPGTGTVDGVNGDHIIIAPPFIVKEQDIDHIVKVVSAVIDRVFKEINK